ncbi:unnamed protein product [Didymodactylos carnosus]|nr:unnamed protein product [Didymodactylos carnosus]CAF3755771.1 unnamed protein product [Didymodactylos carnosus]
MLTLMSSTNNNNSNSDTTLALGSTFNEQTFYRSCLLGDLERAQCILRTTSQININRQNDEGLTLLHLGCISNFYGLVQLLLQHHAQIDIQDENGWTCLHYIAMKGHRALIKLILNKPPSRLPLMELSSSPENSINISKNDYINLCDKQGKTALILACEYGHLDLAELLIEDYKADVNKNNPLHYASIEGKLDVCQLLIKYGSNVKHVLMPKVVQEICQRGHMQVLRLLVNSKYKLSPPSRADGNSVLYHSIITLDKSVVQELLEHEARLNEKDVHDLLAHVSTLIDSIQHLDQYFDCLTCLFQYRTNFDDSKIAKYFIKQLAEQISLYTSTASSLVIKHALIRLKYLFALSLYGAQIPLRKTTAKWCAQIMCDTQRQVNLSDVFKQLTSTWSLRHILRIKIKRSMITFNRNELKKLQLPQHSQRFLAFDYL